MESPNPSGGDTIFGGQSNTNNVTMSGDVVVNPPRLPPPEELAIPCRSCGTKNWPDTRWCPGCGADLQAGRLVAYRITKLVLLAIAVTLLAVIAWNS